MILDNVKEVIKRNEGVLKKFVFHGTRNQNEEFEGIITKTYNSLFLIRTTDGQIRSYSYSDVLISNLEILEER